MNLLLRNLTATVGLFTFASCSTSSGPKGSNASRAQFLDEVWVAPQMRGQAWPAHFNSVYFAPVATGRLKAQGWWAAQGTKTRSQMDADAHRLARYTRNALVTAALNDPSRRLQVVGHPGPGTLIVEVAITELLPAKAFWNAAASAAGFVVPGAGLLSAAGSGAIGFEGRLRDGGTGQTLASFRDRETDKMAFINVDSYTWYAGSEANIDELSKKAAQVLNAPAGAVVSGAAPIKLMAF